MFGLNYYYMFGLDYYMFGLNYYHIFGFINLTL